MKTGYSGITKNEVFSYLSFETELCFYKMFPHLFSVILPHMTYLVNRFGSSQVLQFLGKKW